MTRQTSEVAAQELALEAAWAGMLSPTVAAMTMATTAAVFADLDRLISRVAFRSCIGRGLVFTPVSLTSQVVVRAPRKSALRPSSWKIGGQSASSLIGFRRSGTDASWLPHIIAANAGVR